MAFLGWGDFVIQNLQHLCLLKVMFCHILQLIPVPTLWNITSLFVTAQIFMGQGVNKNTNLL